MAKVRLTVDNIVNLGLWERVCNYKGWDTWILNEGQIESDEYVEFDDQFKKEIEDAENKVHFYTEFTLKLIKKQIDIMDEEDLRIHVNDLSNTLLYMEKVINRLSDEWERYVDYHGQDGHDANIVMGIIKELKGGEKFE